MLHRLLAPIPLRPSTMGLVIDFLTEIIVTVAFLVCLVVVPAWASGLIPGKGSGKEAPSDFSDQPECAGGSLPTSKHAAQLEH
jgi:hypothetical protein